MADFSDMVFVEADESMRLSPPDDFTAFADFVSPQLAVFTPAVGDITPAETFTIQVTDDKQIAFLQVNVETSEGFEVAYTSLDGYSPKYGSLATVSTANIYLAFARVDGLPFGEVTVRVIALDRGGNTLAATRTYTVPGNLSAPVVVNLVPQDNSIISVDQPISFRIEATKALVHVQLIVTAGGHTEVAYDTTLGQSDSYETTVNATDVRMLVVDGLRRIAGWRGDVVLTINASDERGHTLVTQLFYQGEGVDDDAPPYVGLIEPASRELYRSTQVSFRVLHPSGRDEIVWLSITVDFPKDGLWEVVWQDGEFGPYYRSKSTLSRHAGVLHFALQRRSGWPSSPRFVIAGVDRQGQLIQELVDFTGG